MKPTESQTLRTAGQKKYASIDVSSSGVLKQLGSDYYESTKNSTRRSNVNFNSSYAGARMPPSSTTNHGTTRMGLEYLKHSNLKGYRAKLRQDMARRGSQSLLERYGSQMRIEERGTPSR